jgi:hypothetical protein
MIEPIREFPMVDLSLMGDCGPDCPILSIRPGFSEAWPLAVRPFTPLGKRTDKKCPLFVRGPYRLMPNSEKTPHSLEWRLWHLASGEWRQLFGLGAYPIARMITILPWNHANRSTTNQMMLTNWNRVWNPRKTIINRASRNALIDFKSRDGHGQSELKSPVRLRNSAGRPVAHLPGAFSILHTPQLLQDFLNLDCTFRLCLSMNKAPMHFNTTV